VFVWEYKFLFCPDRSVCILIKTEKFLFSEMLEREFLSVCQAYAESHGNIFNYSKTVCMTLKAKSAKSTVTHYWRMVGKNLKSVNQYKYLGPVLDTELPDDKDIQRQLG